MKIMLELSIIITAHNEGLLAHKTMMSVLRALNETNTEYEVLIQIDNGDLATLDYFRRYADNKSFRIFQTRFGDRGKARNAAIEEARGKYLLFLDAHDLISSNYISETLKLLRMQQNNVVVSSQYCLDFWDCAEKFQLQELPNSTTREENAKVLLGINPWKSALAGARELFLAHQYVAMQDGFQDEDYAFNIDLIADNISYRSVPGTTLFCRHDLVAPDQFDNTSQPYNKLFDYVAWKKYTPPEQTPPEKESIEPEPEPEETSDVKKSLLRQTYELWRHDSRVINGIVEPFASLAKTVLRKPLQPEPEPEEKPETTIIEEPLPEIPECVLQEWEEIAKIEKQLSPIASRRKNLLLYDFRQDPRSALGNYYWRLCQQIHHKPNYIFIVPWIVLGGADKVLLNYIKALQEAHANWQITVITTLTAKNLWQDRLPKNVDVIDFGNITQDLGYGSNLQHMILTRLLIQLQCNKIHIINSDLGYKWVRLHPALAKSHFEIYASVFANGLIVDADTGMKSWWGYDDPHLARIYSIVKKVFTDNQNYIDEMIKTDAFDARKLKVIHQPVDLPANLQKRINRDKTQPLKILWASRITFSKNPELLVRIAQKLDATKFRISAFGCMGSDYQNFVFPVDLQTLDYKGPFDGLHSLKLENYDLLLYTSYCDGMPNVLLEAAAEGLPILASNVGGINDFVKDGETGFLVNEIDNEDKYVEILEQVYRKPKLLQEVSIAERELAAKQYSWAQFVKLVGQEF